MLGKWMAANGNHSDKARDIEPSGSKMGPFKMGLRVMILGAAHVRPNPIQYLNSEVEGPRDLPHVDCHTAIMCLSLTNTPLRFNTMNGVMCLRVCALNH